MDPSTHQPQTKASKKNAKRRAKRAAERAATAPAGNTDGDNAGAAADAVRATKRVGGGAAMAPVDSIRHLVVHCKRSPYDVYIGRASAGAPAGADAKWGNPYPMRRDVPDAPERARVSALYREWLLSQPELCAEARQELRGKVLGCWCAPKDCHGLSLAAVANADDHVDVSVHVSAAAADGAAADGAADGVGNGAAAAAAAAAPAAPNGDADGAALPLIDIGINISQREMRREWRAMLDRAAAAGVRGVVLTGVCPRSSRHNLDEAERYRGPVSLRATVGVHPHHSKGGLPAADLAALREMLTQRPQATCVGECGLDYNRRLSPHADQIAVFEAQVALACELNLPLFCHEREAFADFCAVVDRLAGRLPPLVVHCFTGTATEARAYVDRGFFIGFTGTVCKRERGRALRELLPSVPLDRIMLETDAPYMGFVKGRRWSEPADVAGVARAVAECKGVPLADVCRVTTATAERFFGWRAQ